MERLVEVVQRLSLARDLATVMQIVRHAARDLTGADGATFVLREGEQCFYADEDAIAPLWKGRRFALSECISGWVMLHKVPASIKDIYADARIPAQAYRPTFVKSLAMVPIRAAEPLGAIGNYWASEHQPSADELRLLQALADTTAVALENLRVHTELEARVGQRTAALQAILDHVEAGIAWCVDGVVERANPKLASQLGVAAAGALRGRPLRELLQPAADADGLDAALRDGLDSVHSFDAELRLLRSDGIPFWARVAARTLPGGSPVRSTIWLVQDISEAKARERALDELRRTAEAAARFKSEFLASMSHELRTPLNAIMGFSEVLRDGLAGELQPRQLEYIGDIYHSGEHLLELINDVLDLSKIEAGRMAVELGPVDVSQLLHGCLAIVREKAMAHRVTLHAEVAEQIGMALLDARKCKQIVYNLLSNAVKFTPEGGGVLLRCLAVTRGQALRALAGCDRSVQELPAGDEQAMLQIEVRDTGIGISAQDMQRLFEPFVQIDGSLSRQYQGSGLGLSLVRRLSALQRGAVGLRSTLGVGSTFCVWLPLQPADAAGRAVAPVAPPQQPGQPLALVVEDDASAAGLMRLQLERAGCRVAVAASAEQAESLLRQHTPAVIVLDLLLPGIDGWEFLTRLKSDPARAAIPVIVASIVADSGRGIALGAVEALQKPVPAKMLREVLQRLRLTGAEDSSCRNVVLVVDDDPQVLEIVGSLIEAHGCIALRASHGEQALELARMHRPDLVILDLLMPGMSGFEVIAALRAEPASADIPVVVLTARQLDAGERAQLQAQTCHILHKSRFNEQHLLAALRQAMGQD